MARLAGRVFGGPASQRAHFLEPRRYITHDGGYSDNPAVIVLYEGDGEFDGYCDAVLAQPRRRQEIGLSVTA